jgi:hypothetical protein
VSVGNFAVIYDIENAKAPKEVSYLENMTQFMMKDGFVSTGFDLYSSHNEIQDSKEKIITHQIMTNNYQDLSYTENMETDVESGNSVTKINGHIIKTYSYLDLYELSMIQNNLRFGSELDNIDF